MSKHADLLAVFKLAWPISLSFLGIMAMGMVDLICVGHLGPAAIAAVGTTNALFSVALVIGIGLISGLEYKASFHFGAGEHDRHRTFFVQSFWIALVYSGVATVILRTVYPWIATTVADPQQVEWMGPYFEVITWSLFPAILFTGVRMYLQSQGRPAASTVVMIFANLLNYAANWVFIFGWKFIPALGVVGSGYATLLSRIVMIVILFGYLFKIDARVRVSQFPWRPQVNILLDLLKLGTPAATQMALEVGVFALVTVLASRFGSVAGAAHQAVLNTASLTFMVPLGIGAAASVLVGQSLGRQNSPAARRMGNRALLLGALFMLICGFIFLVAPIPILKIYSNEQSVVELGQTLMIAAACFQLSDGLQIVATGALRGWGNTHLAMWANLFGHWLIGLPLGLYLAFYQNMQIVGLWIGLVTGLTAVALLLIVAWRNVSTAPA